MFGFLIPRNYTEALEFDKANNNSKWYDATKAELDSIHSYQVFQKHEKAQYGKQTKVINAPQGYQKIRVHLIVAVKYDGRHKGRLVANRHLTPEPVESIYSGVVSLRNSKLDIFLGKLNNLELWRADIGNAYLEAPTEEKLYIVAGPEFEDWEGYILTFSKTLYGLKSSGKRWVETLHDILKDMNFIASRADQCIWLKKNNKFNLYEYIAVYVDDLCIAAQDPKEITNILKSKYNLKVKGDGPLAYHLGADYFQDLDGTLVSQPKKYIEKLKETYVRLFNTEPSKSLKTPLEKNDHPELDTSEIQEGCEVNHYLTMVCQLQWLITLGRFDIQTQDITMSVNHYLTMVCQLQWLITLGRFDIQTQVITMSVNHYLTMVCQLQWLITLGRFDIQTQVITMSRFRAQPRQGHLERLKRIYAYVIRTKDYATRFRTTEPDYSCLPDQNFDWAHPIYGHVQEIIPDDIPDPLGKSVTTTTTVDANLNHCLATGRSVTGCLHFVNHTPIDSYSKRQANSGNCFIWIRICSI